MSTAILDLEFLRLTPFYDGLGDYTRARALVRVSGRPAAWVLLPVTRGCISAQDVMDALRTQAGPEFWMLVAGQNFSQDAAQPAPLPTVTVAVCTRDRPDDLRRCLEGLARLPDDGQEVLVIDSASRNSATRETVACFAGVRCVRLERPGLNVARNAAMLAASGEIVAFLDDDAVPDAGWLRAHRSSFSSPLTLASTGLTLPIELESEAQEQFEAFSPFSRCFLPRVFSRQNTHPLAAGHAGAGVNMALRREALAIVGPFDEAIDAGTPTQSGGETEFFARLIAAGGRIQYNPAALNWHRHRQSTEALRRAIYGYGVGVYAFWTCRLLAGELAVPLIAAGWAWRDQFPRLLRSLAQRPGAPPWPLPLDEMRGCLVGPWAYLRARRGSNRHRTIGAQP